MLPTGSRKETVANAVRLLGRLLDDLGIAGLQPLEGAFLGARVNGDVMAVTLLRLGERRFAPARAASSTT
ncbi:MAG: hypothetical protein GEU94_09680 [Micromonosporaceae bacterium]|nr:hypothetical protein [Micromonosporaceae bacterium]